MSVYMFICTSLGILILPLIANSKYTCTHALKMKIDEARRDNDVTSTIFFRSILY